MHQSGLNIFTLKLNKKKKWTKYFHTKIDSPDESVDETICRLKDVLQ